MAALGITLALTAWLQTARTVRAGFIQTKELEYVDAARALVVTANPVNKARVAIRF